MAVKAAVFNRLGDHQSRAAFAPHRPINAVCSFWLQGRCTRRPCRFLHRLPSSAAATPPIPKSTVATMAMVKRGLPKSSPSVTDREDHCRASKPQTSVKRSAVSTSPRPEGSISSPVSSAAPIEKAAWEKTQPPRKRALSAAPIENAASEMTQPSRKRSSVCSPRPEDSLPVLTTAPIEKTPSEMTQLWKNAAASTSREDSSPVSTEKDEASDKNHPTVCKCWLSGNCMQGEKCRNLHSVFSGEGFSLMAELQGHKKAVTGVALPSGCDKLFSGSEDGTVRVWDCHTGKCVDVLDLGDDVGCLVNEGRWVFVGLPNVIKAWNTQTNTGLSLEGPAGQVHAIVEGNDDIIFAGAEDGNIYAWKCDAASNSFQPIAVLRGHSGAVVSLVFGANRLYSGSVDHTIKVWDPKTLQCIETLNGHSAVVTSLICWDRYLLSASLDKALKVWALAEGGNLEVIHTHNEEHGVLVLAGMHDPDGKPILLTSLNDNTVCLYELPT